MYLFFLYLALLFLFYIINRNIVDILVIISHLFSLFVSLVFFLFVYFVIQFDLVLFILIYFSFSFVINFISTNFIIHIPILI